MHLRAHFTPFKVFFRYSESCLVCANRCIVHIGAPIILGRCPSLSAHESGSMLRTYLVYRDKQEIRIGIEGAFQIRPWLTLVTSAVSIPFHTRSLKPIHSVLTVPRSGLVELYLHSSVILRSSHRSRPWRPVGLWDVEDPTLSRQSANRWR
jgi:hypothetical protein